MFDDDYRVIGTGSCWGNTLRCFAVSAAHQREGLMNQLISHLIEQQYERGNLHLFLYTKIRSAKFFRDLGFYEIARVNETLVFMGGRRFAGSFRRPPMITSVLLRPSPSSTGSARRKMWFITEPPPPWPPVPDDMGGGTLPKLSCADA